MATNFRVKIGKIGLLAFIRSPGIPKCRPIALSCDDLATLCVNLVNFGPVTPEFKNGKCVQRLVSFFKRNILDKLSQDALHRFSPSFHRMVGI